MLNYWIALLTFLTFSACNQRKEIKNEFLFDDLDNNFFPYLIKLYHLLHDISCSSMKSSSFPRPSPPSWTPAPPRLLSWMPAPPRPSLLPSSTGGFLLDVVPNIIAQVRPQPDIRGRTDNLVSGILLHYCSHNMSGIREALMKFNLFE